MGSGLLRERLLMIEQRSLFGEWHICNSDSVGLSLWGQRRAKRDDASSPEGTAADGGKK